MKRALVTGAGGFIGAALVRYLKAKGYWVRGVDLKRPEWGESAADEFMDELDLRTTHGAFMAFVPSCEGHFAFDEVYALAADMGGMGYISSHNADILHNNSLININTLHAALNFSTVGRYLYTSSACVYPEYRQLDTDIPGLKEADAWPAQPQDAYGLEKLVTEELCKHYRRDYGLQTRIARLHNVYGPYGTYKGGREKAPAAMCRKVAEAKIAYQSWFMDNLPVQPGEVRYDLRKQPSIDIWGDGEQTRSFCYIDDAVEGLYRLMQSDYVEPLNIGSDRMVTINQLADMAAAAAGVDIVKRHVDGPMGVRGRNSDNTLCRAVLGWEPVTPLEVGMKRTYDWIEAQVLADYAVTTREYSEAWVA